MIPFKDDNPTRIFPFVTILLIFLNSAVFLIEILHPAGMKEIVYNFGAIPHNLLSLSTDQPVHILITPFTSMFLHGGFIHIIGNMLYLWIFGNNIEDRLGHIRFLFFYLASGLVAAYAHSITSPNSMIPMIGASGAVSGVLGAYLLLYPHARIHTLLWIGFYIEVVRIPALIVIGFWIIIQIFNGLISKGLMAQGGVAWFAHIGGFIFGLITIRFWIRKSRFY
jgi:membrane associated rhomboid family serine protease